MNVGVTGTREGMTDEQMLDFIRILEGLPGPVTLHHGDCVGVDIEAATIAETMGFTTVSHPPTNPAHRAFHKSTTTLQPKPYLDRNHEIVDSVDLLIAVPNGPERTRSGTWSTVRYARKQARPMITLPVDMEYE